MKPDDVDYKLIQQVVASLVEGEARTQVYKDLQKKGITLRAPKSRLDSATWQGIATVVLGLAGALLDGYANGTLTWMSAIPILVSAIGALRAAIGRERIGDFKGSIKTNN